MTTSTAHMPFSHAPQWDDIPFDVDCPRCGAPLRGCTTAQCPACTLDLDWASLVPINELHCPQCQYLLRGLRDPRCPECGVRFSWQQALDEHRMGSSRLFEHGWNRRPLRSLAHSLRRSFGPRRLWNALDLNDVLHMPALVALGAVAGMLFLVGMTAAFAAIELMDCLTRWRWVFWAGGIETMLGIWIPLIPVWSVASLGALFILQQSMQRCRVRPVHVVRVWAYAIMGPSLLMPLLIGIGGTAGEFIDGMVRVRMSREAMLIMISIPFFLALALICRSIWVAYRDYLKMPHALAVALLSQTAAVLATLTLFMAFQFNRSIHRWVVYYAEMLFG